MAPYGLSVGLHDYSRQLRGNEKKIIDAVVTVTKYFIDRALPGWAMA
jgi:hypothetical protein